MVEPSQNNNNDNHDENDRINGRPPIFYGENFDYWKDMVIDGYIHLVDAKRSEDR